MTTIHFKAASMQAMVFTKYGPPSVLQRKEVAKPKPKQHEVLVKIHSTTVNDYDWGMIQGKPYLLRLMYGLFRPKHQIPGMELSGVVEALGSEVSSFKVGDAVYGDTSNYGFGTLAEYICVHEKALIAKPPAMSFNEAASIPHASMLALQGLVDKGKIQQGQQILINGAGGGVGTFGLQLAKLYQAEVTGVDTGDKLQMMLDLGFDHIIDYKQEDFTKSGRRYDLILDAKTTRSPFAYTRALKPEGRYVTVGGHLFRLLQTLLLKPWISFFNKKQVDIVALEPNKDLVYMNELFEAHKITCIIDGPFPLEQASQAVQYFGEGKHQGKVVLSVTSLDEVSV